MIRCLMRLIMNLQEEWNRFLKTLPYKINVKDGEDLVMELDGKTYSPEV